MNRFNYIILGLLVWWGLSYFGVNDAIIAGTDRLINPLGDETYSVSSEFGMRLHPITGDYKMHYGIDLANADVDAEGNGIPIYASGAGEVTIAQTIDYGTGYGKYVRVKHSNGSLETLYGHMNNVLVNVKENVIQGQIIGYMGTTGSSTGVHLHFETILEGKHVDPRNYVGFIQ